MKTKKIILVALLIVAALTSIASASKPSENWTLHIDAQKHFPANPDWIAHHYCKAVAGGLIE
ncbi:MAG: hypothetical protein WC568_00160 [Candidatus Methanoperedens sp.]